MELSPINMHNINKTRPTYSHLPEHIMKLFITQLFAFIRLGPKNIARTAHIKFPVLSSFIKFNTKERNFIRQYLLSSRVFQTMGLQDINVFFNRQTRCKILLMVFFIFLQAVSASFRLFKRAMECPYGTVVRINSLSTINGIRTRAGRFQLAAIFVWVLFLTFQFSKMSNGDTALHGS